MEIATPASGSSSSWFSAKKRANSAAGVWAYRRRMADAEGVIAELKNVHGLDRVRCRGTPAFHVQLLLGCAAINLKRLANHVPTAHEGRAAAPATAAATLGTAADHQRRHQSPAAIRLGRKQLLWTASLCLN